MTTETPESPALNWDSRLYTTPRVRCDAGYAHRRPIRTDLGWMLSFFRRFSGRMIEQGEGIQAQQKELWSCNSTIIPYLAGIKPAGYDDSFPLPPSPSIRRFDGSIGPFDPSSYPQYLDQEHLWYPFMIRPDAPIHVTFDYPEFTCLSYNWESTSAQSGKLSDVMIADLRSRNAALSDSIDERTELPSYAAGLWANRPLYPADSDIEALADERWFENMVDRGAAVQRGMKSKAAWLEMVKGFEQLGSFETFELTTAIPSANEKYLGVWINGAPKPLVEWLMQMRVPCFIAHAHERNGGRNLRILPPTIRVDRSYEEGTYADLCSRRPANEYTRIAELRGAETTEYVEYEYPPDVLFGTQLDRDRSSSLWQGWDLGYPFPRIETRFYAHIASSYNSPIPPDPVPQHVQSFRTAATASLSIADEQIFQDCHRVYLSPCRVPLIRPPPEADVMRREDGGSYNWDFYVESPTNEIYEAINGPEGFKGWCFKQVSKSKASKLAGARWYDREYMRILIIPNGRDLYIPPGVVEVDQFGAPCPGTLFFSLVGGTSSIHSWVAPSTWVYRSMTPTSRTRLPAGHRPVLELTDYSVLPDANSVPPHLRVYGNVDITDPVLKLLTKSFYADVVASTEFPPHLSPEERARKLEVHFPSAVSTRWLVGHDTHFVVRASPLTIINLNRDDEEAVDWSDKYDDELEEEAANEVDRCTRCIGASCPYRDGLVSSIRVEYACCSVDSQPLTTTLCFELATCSSLVCLPCEYRYPEWLLHRGLSYRASSSARSSEAPPSSEDVGDADSPMEDADSSDGNQELLLNDQDYYVMLRHVLDRPPANRIDPNEYLVLTNIPKNDSIQYFLLLLKIANAGKVIKIVRGPTGRFDSWFIQAESRAVACGFKGFMEGFEVPLAETPLGARFVGKDLFADLESRGFEAFDGDGIPLTQKSLAIPSTARRRLHGSPNRPTLGSRLTSPKHGDSPRLALHRRFAGNAPTDSPSGSGRRKYRKA